MTTVQTNLQSITHKIATIAEQCERDRKTIQLIAVSKTKPVSLIEQAIAVRQRLFGENYVQEGVEKIQYFKQKNPDLPLEWHFIGPLQSNKTKLVAEHFDWVHTIDRLKIASRLSEQRPTSLSPLNVLIQINISHEDSKSGINPTEMLDLANQIKQLPNLKLRGLMAIPKEESDPKLQINTFKQMHQLYQQLQQHINGIDTLSMGMTNDMEAAIQTGSTMVRIGTAIFGSR